MMLSIVGHYQHVEHSDPIAAAGHDPDQKLSEPVKFATAKRPRVGGSRNSATRPSLGRIGKGRSVANVAGEESLPLAAFFKKVCESELH